MSQDNTPRRYEGTPPERDEFYQKSGLNANTFMASFGQFQKSLGVSNEMSKPEPLPMQPEQFEPPTRDNYKNNNQTANLNQVQGNNQGFTQRIPIKILIADADRRIYDWISQVTILEQYELVYLAPALTGQSAIEIANAIQPDIILLDLMISLPDSAVVMEEYRTLGIQAVKIITAPDNENMRTYASQMGADFVLGKLNLRNPQYPYAQNEIRNIIYMAAETVAKKKNMNMQVSVSQNESNFNYNEQASTINNSQISTNKVTPGTANSNFFTNEQENRYTNVVEDRRESPRANNYERSDENNFIGTRSNHESAVSRNPLTLNNNAGYERGVLKDVRNYQEDNFSTRSRKAEVIVFGGTKGGAGKTTISFNTAVAAADKGLNVLFIELDMNYATVDLYIRRRGGKSKPLKTLSDLVRTGYIPEQGRFSQEILNDIIWQTEDLDTLDIISGVPIPAEQSAIKGEQIKALIQQVSPNYDLVIIDTSCDINYEPVTNALLLADKVVFVARCDITIRNTQTVLIMLSDWASGINSPSAKLLSKMHMVINFAVDKGVFTTRNARAALEEFRPNNVDPSQWILAEVPFDRVTAETTLNKGKPAVIDHADSPLATGIFTLVERLGIGGNSHRRPKKAVNRNSRDSMIRRDDDWDEEDDNYTYAKEREPMGKVATLMSSIKNFFNKGRSKKPNKKLHPRRK